MTNAEMQHHVITLAAAKGVVVVIDSKMSVYECFARTAVRPTDSSLHLVPVINDTTYAIQLHELGHVLSPDAAKHLHDQENLLLKLQSEQAAWEWAKKNAKQWTPAMESIATVALRTYTHGGPPPDIPGHPTFAEYAATVNAGAQQLGNIFEEVLRAAGAQIPARPVMPPPVAYSPAQLAVNNRAWKSGLKSFGKKIAESRKK